MLKVIGITGPSGVGKTDTGWDILEKLNGNNISSALLDVDWLANIRPFDWSKTNDVLFVLDELQLITLQHVKRKTQVLILPYCYEVADNIEIYEKFCIQNGIVFNKFCLICDLDTIKARILNRYRNETQKQNEYKNAASFLALYNSQKENFGDVIDNSNLSISDTGKYILKRSNI